MAVKCVIYVPQGDIDDLKKHSTTPTTDSKVAKHLAMTSIEGRKLPYVVVVET